MPPRLHGLTPCLTLCLTLCLTACEGKPEDSGYSSADGGPSGPGGPGGPGLPGGDDTGALDTADTDTTGPGGPGSDDTGGATDGGGPSGPGGDDTDDGADERPPADRYDLGGADLILSGEAEDDGLGRAVAGVGDVDGDDRDDVLIGADNAEGRLGAAYLLMGDGGQLVFVGEAESDNLGSSLAGGDVNGDGYDDVVMGAWGNDDGGYLAGAAYLVLGRSGGPSAGPSGAYRLSGADAKFTGEDIEGGAGSAVAVADVNGDGDADVIVGAFWDGTDDTEPGTAYIVEGPVSGNVALRNADAKLRGESPGDFASLTTANAGDVNGDGLEDLILGAYSNDNAGGEDAGAAYLVLGGRGASALSGSLSLSSADAKFTGETAGDQVGYSVSGRVDVDDDGYDDLILGNRKEDYEAEDYGGKAYIISGAGASGTRSLSLADVTLLGETPSDAAGATVSGAGDVNGDGIGDILVGAFRHDVGGEDSGAAYLVLGQVGLSGTIELATAEIRYDGEGTDSYTGIGLAAAGDYNRDGEGDVLIGASRADGDASDSGVAYLIFSGGL